MRLAGIATGILLMVSGVALAQGSASSTQNTHRSATKSLKVSGVDGQVPMVERNGHSYVDVDALARLVHGSVSYTHDGVTLTLPAGGGSGSGARATNALTRDFQHGAIAALASIREWRVWLSDTISKGQPLTTETIQRFRQRADQLVSTAATAAATDGDRSAAVLLRNQLGKMTSLSDGFQTQRANLSFIGTSDMDSSPLNGQVQSCGQGLGAMVDSGEYADVRACH